MWVLRSVEKMSPTCIDNLLKITQITFYIVTGVVVVLTYLKAKDTLLNSVNTEYQKKVINRLEELANELGSEFDSKSPNYWALHNPIREFIDQINETFAEQREELEELGYYPYGYPVSAHLLRLRYIVDTIESDPFVPEHIRTKVKEVLGKREQTLSDVFIKEFDKYFKALLKGNAPLSTQGDDPEFDKFHNKIIQKLNKKESVITAYQEQIHQIRLAVQEYLESFDPFRGKRKGA